ncbi:unnamed protein product [Bemisia tabaci]|uniref:Pseudouridine synthase II N-terminal domain-containing protein n=1 Tax=Bemisia tabaci TaxID=7038 RepID=A0A9P0AK17_BEMTA|nr:PREDICTED: probable tRNA pseudouridine synthase 2 [Bemisia tabaci]CAH0393216.1 unnamed protein product [Bemisia tabaci]
MTNVTRIITSQAPVVWKNLNGLICVHKPSERSVKSVRKIIAERICNELNELEVRPPTTHVSIVGDTTKELDVQVKPSFADHPAVVGPRYIPEELYISTGNFLGYHTSGVLVLGLQNLGAKKAKFLRNSSLLRTYQLKGKLGVATANFFMDGKVLFRGRYDYITRDAVDKVAATMEALHRKVIFDLCSVDPRSQTAYDWASQGLLRPFKTKSPVIYGIKCVDYSPPEFTVEVQCTNETEEFLIELISKLAAKLRTAAACVQIKCIRFSHFDIDDALLKKHWSLQHFLDSVLDGDTKYQKIRDTISPTLVNFQSEETST